MTAGVSVSFAARAYEERHSSSSSQLWIVPFVRVQVSLVLLGWSTIFFIKHINSWFQIIVNNNFRGSRENNPRTWASIDPRLHVIAPPPPATRASCSLSLSLSVSPIVVETHISKHVCFFFIVVIGLKLLASCHMLYVTYITGRYIFK